MKDKLTSAALGKPVLRVPHSGIIEGSKQVQMVESQGDENSSGVGIHWRLKEMALKDIMNKLEPAPMNLKPTWNAPHLGMGTAMKKNVFSKNKAHVSRAHLLVVELLSTGAGLMVGQHATRLPDPLVGSDKGGIL